ncbi:hypothetical protein ACH5RR_021947 [Cinchona calisaya]|uniref:Uncharacterized protein n=1 Tax=Cinchona calisaya TaxID=153742 RepID=A0ABD2Z6D4_9GENT
MVVFDYVSRGIMENVIGAGREVKAIREDCPPGKEEGKRCFHPSNPFPSLPHCSSKCATPYEQLLLFCPLSVHTVLKAEEEVWVAGTMSPLSHTSIQKQV